MLRVKHPEQPPLNTVLKFTKEAHREIPLARRKRRNGIVENRLQYQRKSLSKNLLKIADTKKLDAEFNGFFHAEVSMFEDSYAPTWTPDSLFSHRRGVQFILPTKNGYLIELHRRSINDIAKRVENTLSVSEQVDISRVSSICSYQASAAFQGAAPEDIWENALIREDGRVFTIHLLPFNDNDASEELLSLFLRHQDDKYRSLGPLVELQPTSSLEQSRTLAQIYARGDRIAQLVRNYRANRRGSTSICIQSLENLIDLVATGVVFSIEPTRPLIQGDSGTDGEVKTPPLPNLTKCPVVGVVDGGLTAPDYEPAISWRLSTRLENILANTDHGNEVSSSVVLGSEWNPELNLPKLNCRLGLIQVIPNNDAPLYSRPTEDELIA